jgi:serine/threonine-protein kinase SRK2
MCNAREPQKIVTADFSFPPGVAVSEEVRDLLQRIFVVNTAHRLNLDGIKAHPWFLRNLPAELQARGVLQRFHP